MTIFVRSLDGTTIDKVAAKPDPEVSGDFVVMLQEGSAEEDLNANNWYIAAPAGARPADTPTETYKRSVVNTAVGVFEEQWLHDAARHTIRLDQETRQALRANLGTQIATLRSWADDAEATTVDSGNAVATLQIVVDRLGTFFDHFADLLEAQGYDQ